jgi:hypothetical protein
MPYNLEQGPYLAMLEDLINKNPVRCLNSLRDAGQPVTDILRNPSIDIPGRNHPHQTTAALADHIDKDWFGIKPGSQSDPTSRYWPYWEGDAQGIVRETIVRAIEIALGLDHDDAAPEELPRQWHVSLLTACGIRWFEGWVSWRRVGDGAGDGHVTVFLLTPSHGKPAEPSLLRPSDSSRQTPPGEPYQVNPTRAEGAQGLWAVGALLEYRRDPESGAAKWLPPGEFPRPHLGPTYVGMGDIVVVAPPEAQGGVLADGRPYQAAS